MSMILVGLAGPISHGKTTFGDMLASQNPESLRLESSDLIAAVINEWFTASTSTPRTLHEQDMAKWIAGLEDAAQEILHIKITPTSLMLSLYELQNLTICHPKLSQYLSNPPKTETINNTSKERFRPLLQWVGGYLVEKLGGVWYKELIRQAVGSRKELVIIGGVRFASDAAQIRSAGGVVVKVFRPAMEVRDANDLTEKERDLIVPDATVYNDGSLGQLEGISKKILQDSINHQLQREYHTGK